MNLIEIGNQFFFPLNFLCRKMYKHVGAKLFPWLTDEKIAVESEFLVKNVSIPQDHLKFFRKNLEIKYILCTFVVKFKSDIQWNL